MYFHVLAPLGYKKLVVCGFIHRISHACSTWENFHTSLEKAIKILHDNQYPSDFYEPLIRAAMHELYNPPEISEVQSEEDEGPKQLVFLQYWGKVTDKYVRTLNIIKAPCKTILTLPKLVRLSYQLLRYKSQLFQSPIAYKLLCPLCQACYVGQTNRHLLVQYKDYCQPSKPFCKHIGLCAVSPSFDDKNDVSILQPITRILAFLETLEALWQREIYPSINTKDEYRIREVTIKL